MSAGATTAIATAPWQSLNLRPLPQGQGSLRPTFVTIADPREDETMRSIAAPFGEPRALFG
jgi:hypothetical protein